MQSKQSTRIRIFSLLVVLGTLVCIVRLYFLQIVHQESFVNKADRQYVSQGRKTFDRGSIFFQDKNGMRVVAASLGSGYFLAIVPAQIDDVLETYEKINAYIPLDKENFIERANRKDDPYEEIAWRISEENARPVMELKLPGVRFYRDYWRFYPGNSLAAQTLGFVAFKENDLVGRYGLERQYEPVLERSSQEVYVNSFAQIFSDIKTFVSDESVQGDIVTTIEPSVQQFLETQLQKTQETWDATLTGGIIMDPKTGAIYGLGTYPSFDLNTFQKQSNPGIYSNPLIEHVYELGSIVKPLTVAAGLDAGVITAQSTYTDTGSITLNSKKISNYDGVARGVVDMQEVLNKSLNLGVSFITNKLGKETFRNYFYDFGIGSETGIDLPNEARGLTSTLESPRDVEYATASFGQGIAVSPIAMTRALATLGNGGVLVTPHIVKQFEYENGVRKDVELGVPRRVLKKETSEEITRMLVKVYDDALLDGKVKMEHYSIAAKTGTAQMAREGGGGYYTDRYLHSFFGYFPAYDPQFIVFLYTVYPKGVDYASHTLTDPFVSLANFLISYYQIPPDR